MVGIAVKEVVQVKGQRSTIGRIPVMTTEARRLPGSDPCVTITEVSVEKSDDDGAQMRTWSGYPFVSMKSSHNR